MALFNHLFLALIISTFGVCISAQANDSSHIFDAAAITDWSNSASSAASVSMDARRDNGLPWVFYYYVAVAEQRGGETRFGAMPDGIEVNVMDVQFHFSEKSMTHGLPASITSLQNFIHQKLPDLNGNLDIVNLNAYHPDDLRYQSFLKVYNYEKLLASPTYFGVNLLKTERLKPVALYMVSGQGEVPDEIKQMIKESNGSWFGRYRHIIFSFFAALCGIYVIYRFVTR